MTRGECNTSFHTEVSSNASPNSIQLLDSGNATLLFAVVRITQSTTSSVDTKPQTVAESYGGTRRLADVPPSSELPAVSHGEGPWLALR